MMRRPRERRVLLATALCAIGAPLSAAAWLSARTQALADHVGATGGGVARIGTVDADLTGTVRLSDVGFGALIAAEAVEASVGLDSLLAGTLRADEIRVAGPRVAIHVDSDGDSDLARLARRLAGPHRARATTEREPRRLRRIVVSAGALSAHVAGLGDLAADRVELIPDAGGVRVLTGNVRLAGSGGPLRVDLGFARSAAELSLPQLRIGRVLAVGGTGAITAQSTADPPGAPSRAALRDVAVGRLAAAGTLELRASIDDNGIPRAIAIDVEPRHAAVSIRGERVPLGGFAALAPHGFTLDAAHATGTLEVRRAEPGQLALEIDGSLDGVAVDHRVLAAGPVPLAATVHASLAISDDAISVPRAAIDLGAARWTASGWLRRGSPASGQLELSLATTACSDPLAALPAELRGPLDGMLLGGSFGGRLRLAVDLAAPIGDGVQLTTDIADACRTEGEPPAADVARLVGPPSAADDGSRAAAAWTPLRQLPSHVAAAFVSAEDARFYDHTGFDLQQIAHSLEIDLRERRLARGGSTISQQLVKNAFLSQRRSLDRKLQEAILTWRLEARLTKPQILERYLNIIELGPRVFGITAAAKHWFDVSPRDLSVRQAAFLAALTAEPTSMSRRVRRAGGLDPDSAARVDLVVRAMRFNGQISADQLETGRQAALRFTPAALKQER